MDNEQLSEVATKLENLRKKNVDKNKVTQFCDKVFKVSAGFSAVSLIVFSIAGGWDN